MEVTSIRPEQRSTCTLPFMVSTEMWPERLRSKTSATTVSTVMTSLMFSTRNDPVSSLAIKLM